MPGAATGSGGTVCTPQCLSVYTYVSWAIGSGGTVCLSATLKLCSYTKHKHAMSLYVHSCASVTAIAVASPLATIAISVCGRHIEAVE